MKKLLAFMSIAVATTTMMFANVEINLRFSGNFTNVKTEEDWHGAALKTELQSNLFGFDNEINFWFGHPWILDIGLSTGFDFGFGTAKNTTEYTVKGIGIETSGSKFSGGVGLSLAPAVQFNVGAYNSFFVAPGIRFGTIFTTANTMTAYFIPEFALDLAYKFWFSKHVGLNVGYQLEVPFTIYSGCKESSAPSGKLDYNSAIGNRLVLGFAFNIGKRYYGTGYDE